LFEIIFKNNLRKFVKKITSFMMNFGEEENEINLFLPAKK
jgi:hypothetical protein